jgi:hypothetical protein
MNRITIRQWLLKHNIKRFALDSDNKVNVFEDVNLSSHHLKMLPIDFGIVYGNFDISYNQLTTLKGFPEEIQGTLNASHNQLICIDYLPHTVLYKIDLSHNQIHQFTHFFIPKKVSKLFLHNNQLSYLKLDNHVVQLTLFHNDFNELGLLETLQYFSFLEHLTSSIENNTEEQKVELFENEKAIIHYMETLSIYSEKKQLEKMLEHCEKEAERGKTKI